MLIPFGPFTSFFPGIPCLCSSNLFLSRPWPCSYPIFIFCPKVRVVSPPKNFLSWFYPRVLSSYDLPPSHKVKNKSNTWVSAHKHFHSQLFCRNSCEWNCSIAVVKFKLGLIYSAKPSVICLGFFFVCQLAIRKLQWDHKCELMEDTCATMGFGWHLCVTKLFPWDSKCPVVIIQ